MAGVIEDIRNLLEFRRRLGITFYPRGRGAAKFLAGPSRPVPPAPPSRPRPEPAAARPVRRPQPGRDPGPALAALGQAVAQCRKCPRRRDGVPPTAAAGDGSSGLMVVVDGPAAGDVAAGGFLNGEAGALFDRMLAAIGLDRGRIRLTGMTHCAPAPWKAPDRRECLACQPWLLREMTIVRPRVILVMGPAAAAVVCGSDAPLSRLRGRFIAYAGIAAMVSHPPAALLRDNRLKKESWADLQAIQARLR